MKNKTNKTVATVPRGVAIVSKISGKVLVDSPGNISQPNLVAIDQEMTKIQTSSLRGAGVRRTPN